MKTVILIFALIIRLKSNKSQLIYCFKYLIYTYWINIWWTDLKYMKNAIHNWDVDKEWQIVKMLGVLCLFFSFGMHSSSHLLDNKINSDENTDHPWPQSLADVCILLISLVGVCLLPLTTFGVHISPMTILVSVCTPSMTSLVGVCIPPVTTFRCTYTKKYNF